MNRRSLFFGFAVAAMLTAALALNVGVTRAGGNTASATGSGQILQGSPPELRNFTFNARTDSSGVSSGQTEAFTRAGGRRWHGTLDCLSVSGNVATMSGVVTDVDPVTPPAFVPGNFILFQVIDNGEGSNAPPDKISLTFFFPTGSSNPGCTGFGIFATIPIVDGNVQVH